MEKVSAILTAGGIGKRFGGDKQVAELFGTPVACISAKKLLENECIAELVIVTKPERELVFKKYLDMLGTNGKRIVYVPDGPERYDSVHNGMMMVSPDYNIVLVHDGARPLVTQEMITSAVTAVTSSKKIRASFVGTPVVDTLRRMNREGIGGTDENGIIETVDRSNLYQVQTPQVVLRYDWIRSFDYIKENGLKVTDDIQMIEIFTNTKASGLYPRFLVKPIVMEGSRFNIKITVPEDLKLAEAIIAYGLANI